jgi:hypothetical protein
VSSFSGFFQAYAGRLIYGNGLHFGMFTFPWLARRLEFITASTVADAMQQREAFVAAQGFMGQSWQTAFVSYILDFGYAGAVVFMLLVGAVSGFAWRIHSRQPTVFSLALIFAANIHLFYLIMFPATSDSVFLFFVIQNTLLCFWLPGKIRRPENKHLRRGVG